MWSNNVIIWICRDQFWRIYFLWRKTNCDIERWVDLWTLVLEDISMSCKNLKTWRGLIAQHEDHIKKIFSYWNVEFEECTFACEIQIKIDWWMARRLCAGWMFVCWFRHLGNLKISRLSYGSRSWNSCVWSKE